MARGRRPGAGEGTGGTGTEGAETGTGTGGGMAGTEEEEEEEEEEGGHCMRVRCAHLICVDGHQPSCFFPTLL